MKHKRIPIIWTVLVVFALLTAGFGLRAEADGSSKEREAFKSAKQLIYQKEWAQAVTRLQELSRTLQGAETAAETLYWLAYSLNQLSRTPDAVARRVELKVQAVERLNQMLKKYPGNEWAEDGEVLRIEVAEALVKLGRGDYRRYITNGAATTGQPTAGESGMDTKLVALDALLQMDDAKALPLLKKIILENPRADVRKRALFVVAQHSAPEIESILLNAAKNDKAPEVRKEAVFWLGQRDSATGLKALLALYGESRDAEVKKAIVFALGQQDSEEAFQQLRRLAMQESNPALQGEALFWLAQSHGEKALPTLLELYGKSGNREARKKILFGISQIDGAKADEALGRLARSESDPDMQGEAIFWISQRDHSVPVKVLQDLYRDVKSLAGRRKVVFCLGQIESREAVRALIEIARTEKDVQIRKEAIFWLGQSKFDEAVKYLAGLVNE